jgi:hypothetical protein
MIDERSDGRQRDRLIRRCRQLGLGFMVVHSRCWRSARRVSNRGGWGHLLQIAAVVLLGAAAWTRPRIGGPLLTLAGAVLSVMMLVDTDEALWTRFAAIAVLFAQLMTAGILFSLAGCATPRAPAHTRQGRCSNSARTWRARLESDTRSASCGAVTAQASGLARLRKLSRKTHHSRAL